MDEATPASLTSLLENATCGELEVSLMALSEAARTRLQTTLEHVDLQTRVETEITGTLPPSSAQVTYCVAFVDGSEMDVSLEEDASVQDAILAIAEKKGTNPGRLTLLVSGQTDLLPHSREKNSLVEAAQKQTDLMVVLKKLCATWAGYWWFDIHRGELWALGLISLPRTSFVHCWGWTLWRISSVLA